MTSRWQAHVLALPLSIRVVHIGMLLTFVFLTVRFVGAIVTVGTFVILPGLLACACPVLAAIAVNARWRGAPVCVTLIGIWNCTELYWYGDVLAIVSTIVGIVSIAAVWTSSARLYLNAGRVTVASVVHADVPRTRLDMDEPELVSAVRVADATTQRETARSAALWALGVRPVDDVRIATALVLFDQGGYGDSPERTALEALVEELDKVAWDIQDLIGISTSEDEYGAAFEAARAVHSLWFALGSDPLEAAIEAAYEARATTDSPQELIALLERTL